MRNPAMSSKFHEMPVNEMAVGYVQRHHFLELVGKFCDEIDFFHVAD
jgi:hypothetical protein